MKCPKCHLENQLPAERCDCGYDFATKTMSDSSLELDQTRPDSAIGKEARSRLTGSAGSSFWLGIVAVGLISASPYLLEVLILGIPIGIAMKGLGFVFGTLAVVRGIGSLRAFRGFEGGSAGKSYAVFATVLGLVVIGPLLLFLLGLLILPFLKPITP